MWSNNGTAERHLGRPPCSPAFRSLPASTRAGPSTQSHRNFGDQRLSCQWFFHPVNAGGVSETWKIPKKLTWFGGVPPWKSPMDHLWGFTSFNSFNSSATAVGLSFGPRFTTFHPRASTDPARHHWRWPVSGSPRGSTYGSAPQLSPRDPKRGLAAWYAFDVQSPGRHSREISLHWTWFRYLWRKKGCEIQLSSPSCFVSQTQFSHQFSPNCR